MAQKKTLGQLSPAQAEIMELIWESGGLSAHDIRKQLSERGRDVTRNTIRTMLARMEEKGWVRHRGEGRTYWYEATQPRKTSVGRKVKELVDRLCGGQPQLLVNALLEEGNLTKKELDEIRGLLADAKPVKETRRKRSKK